MPAFLRLRTGCDRDALAKTRRAQTGVKRVPTQGLGRTHEQTQRRVKRGANGAQTGRSESAGAVWGLSFAASTERGFGVVRRRWRS